jgi:hypothetical protein
MKSVNKLLERPVDVVALIEQLTFDSDELEQAALDQPQLYLDAARWRVQQLRLQKARLARLEQRKAKVGLGLRRKKHSRSDKSLTNPAVAELIEIDVRVKRLRMKLERAFVREEFGKHLLEAFRQRSMLLQSLLKLRSSEISNELAAVKTRMAEAEIGKRRNKLRDKYSRVRDVDEDDDE